VNYIVAGSRNLAGRRSAAAVKMASAFSKDALLPRIVELIALAPELQFKSNAVVPDTKAQQVS
jgi:hypothetical protein